MTSEAWTDCAKVTITAQAASLVNLEFYSLTESIDISDGSRDIESTPVLCGGKITRLKPQEDCEITMKCYPVLGFNPVATGTGTGLDDLFYDTLTTIETSNQYRVSSTSGTRKKFRIAILWTDEASVTNAIGALAKTTQALRYACRNAYMTDIKRSFAADGLLSYDVTFKYAPRQKDGRLNIIIESQNASAAATLAALNTVYSTDIGGLVAGET